jgi:hypothetical protein
MTGHLDRRIILPNGSFPVEIKSLGRFSWVKFQKGQFKDFHNYACQECVYLEAEQKPGIYWVMNRDTGQSLKYIINDFNKEIDLQGFERIELPVKFNDIIDKLNVVEVYVNDSVLPDGTERDDCRYCKFKYLCVKGQEFENDTKEAPEVNIPDLLEAAALYKEALVMEREAVEQKNMSKLAIINHARTNSLSKFKMAGLSVSYRGQKTKKWLDEKTIRSNVTPDIVRLAERESAPYDDITIRQLKSE